MDDRDARRYEIRIATGIDPTWFRGLVDLEVRPAGDDTLLVGAFADQAALHGLLNRIRDLGWPLVSVRPLSEEEASQ